MIGGNTVVGIEEGLSKEKKYEEIRAQLITAFTDHKDLKERKSMLIKLLANHFPHWSFIGYYEADNEAKELNIGEYITEGVYPCSPIEYEKGVCGTCAFQGVAQVVEDVKTIENYIACDDHTRSEIVIPCYINAKKDQALQAVLDIDSPKIGDFNHEDKTWLECLVDLVYTTYSTI